MAEPGWKATPNFAGTTSSFLCFWASTIHWLKGIGNSYVAAFPNYLILISLHHFSRPSGLGCSHYHGICNGMTWFSHLLLLLFSFLALSLVGDCVCLGVWKGPDGSRCYFKCHCYFSSWSHYSVLTCAQIILAFHARKWGITAEIAGREPKRLWITQCHRYKQYSSEVIF